MIAYACDGGWGSTCRPYDGGWTPFVLGMSFLVLFSVIALLMMEGSEVHKKIATKWHNRKQVKK